MAKVALQPYANGLVSRWMEQKTASYTCTKADSGTIFHTTGATAAVTFTLPAISDGPYYFTFINGADVDMTVASVVADTIVTFNDLNADSVAFAQASEKIGGVVDVFCDGTTLFALARIASEAQTIAITTA